MQKIKHKPKTKTCKFCGKKLKRVFVNQAPVCPDEDCRKNGRKRYIEKKNNQYNSAIKTYAKSNISEPLTENLIEKIISNNKNSNVTFKKKSNICSSCGGKIRKNYPFGKNSNVKITGHTQNCKSKLKGGRR